LGLIERKYRTTTSFSNNSNAFEDIASKIMVERLILFGTIPFEKRSGFVDFPIYMEE